MHVIRSGMGLLAGLGLSLSLSSSFTAFDADPGKSGKPGLKEKRPVVIAYIGGFRGLIHTDSIDVSKLSHINYAFVDIRGGQAWLHNEAIDTVNLRNLVCLKSQNPSLKILISIGGWSWSKGFSDAVLTDSSRAVFAASSIAILTKFKLDGVDIDWEYPGLVGDGNKFRPEDKQHYTLFFKTLREGLDSLGKITGEPYLITTAVGGSQDFIEHTEMNLAAKYLDYVNIMSYDFKEGGDSLSGHHTNLYTTKDPHDAWPQSVDRSVQAFESAGVPSSKLVLGIAFYGHGWIMKTDENKGLYRAAAAPFRAGGFTYIKDSLIDRKEKGFVRYWDKTAHAPYLFQPHDKIFISFDDEESVRDKCKYARKHKLAGVMFWEYNNDKKGYLLEVIAGVFGYR